MTKRKTLQSTLNNNEELIWLNTTYAYGELVLKNKIIIDSTPIYKWMIGKRLSFILKYLRRKNQLISYNYRSL